jgi:ferrochelatase
MTIGVLVMAYGGPDNLDEVEPYLLDVRGQRPTAPEIVAEVRERYRQIGGRSPILERTQAQAQALQAALDALGPGEFKTFVGMRHWRPYIKDALVAMAGRGLPRAVTLAMAPHYSLLSIGAYQKKVAEASAPIAFAHIDRWGLLFGYLEALAGRVRDALERFPAEERDDVHIIFTAHSLPQRIRDWHDPYTDELAATGTALMQRLGPRPYHFAYQSAAITPDPWLGPDAGQVIAELAAQGHKNVLIAPVGFVCEHVEILYDVDVVFKRQAESLGMHFERIEMLNTAPAMIDDLAKLVRARAVDAGWL